MKKQFGFTLLELLIAMTLVGLVLVMLYGGLRLGMQSWESGERHAQAANEIRVVHDFVRRLLRQSRTVFVNSDQGRIIGFSGAVDRLMIVTPMLSHLGRGGLYFVEFDVIRDADSDHLRMRWWPFQPVGIDDGTADDAEEAILLSGVEGVRWDYFGVEQGEQEPQWYEQWSNLLQRPRLIRLVLTVQKSSWPYLVVRITD